MENTKSNFRAFIGLSIAALSLTACSTGGGRVLPSIIAESELARTCRTKALDIIPNTPFITQGFLDNSGNGTAADGISRFLEGFETIEFIVTQDAINIGANLSPTDPAIWGLRPLVNQTGIANLAIVEHPHPGCDAFEAVVKTQGEPDAARFFTYTKFAPNPPRNWCVNAFSYSQSAMEFAYETNQSAVKEGDATINQKTEILRQSGQIVARRTQIWLSRPQFPIGVVNVNTDCEGRAITAPQPEFIGKNGIALRPKREPNLVAVSN